MNLSNIPFGTTDWSTLARTEHPGITGKAFWRTKNFNNIRVRMVEYTPGYLADHWCQKGHVLLVLEGELLTELADGRTVVLKPGHYVVRGPGGNKPIEVKTGQWISIESISLLPGGL